MNVVYFRGRPACRCLALWLPVYERELIDRGLLKVELDIYQLIGSATASANTHKGGGAADLAQYAREQIRVARQMGAAASDRTVPPFTTRHCHLVLKGCPHADPSAKAQVVEIEAGGDGLVGSAPDAGPRDVQIPFRTWSEGVTWAETNQRRRTLTAKIRAQRKALVRGRRRLARLVARRDRLS